LVRARIEESISVKQLLLQDARLRETIAEAGLRLTHALRHGHKVFFFGNGGSAADAQHLAAELVGRFEADRRALPAMALTVNTSCLTAIGNDYSFDEIFSRQLEAFGAPGDVALGISTSGNSRNVLHAIATATAHGMITIALTGESGGKLKPLVRHCICAPSAHTARIQEMHILAGHILCEIVEQELFRSPAARRAELIHAH
jgi:D-sedoheptulose 7-phosphate isomerase